MEPLLYIIVFVILFLLTKGLNELRKQYLRDKAAKEILELFDYQKEKKEILNIVVPFMKNKSKCFLCGGDLMLHNGKYGQYWQCNNCSKIEFIKK